MIPKLKDKFLTVGSGPYISEIKIQGSRFVAQIFHTATQDKAVEKYAQIKKKYHDATHNCYAYRIDMNQYRFSDDGEPSGTAGRPILHIIEGRDLFQTLTVVTRYFGGTKLGTGGLKRAYSEAVRKCLDQVYIIEKTRFKEVKITTKYDLLDRVREIISRHQGNIISSDYSDKVILISHIPLGEFNSFQEEIIHNVEISEL
ncbi:MAG: YigZ family protein [Calditrichae bacterium]|nr:YigZ family protein [Calditrichia bacterium]